MHCDSIRITSFYELKTNSTLSRGNITLSLPVSSLIDGVMGGSLHTQIGS